MTRSENGAGKFSHDWMTLCWIFSSFVVFTAAIIYLVRWGWLSPGQTSDDLGNVLRVSSMGLAILWAPYLMTQLTRSLPSSVQFLLLFGVLFTPWMMFRILPDWVAQPAITSAFAAISALGIFLGLWTRGLKKAILPITFGLVLSCVVLTGTLGKGYISPFAFENALAGLQHRDTLYHALIAGMIEYHGQVSTGLDGFVPLQYHVLTHRLFGSIATWLDVPTLKASNLVVSIVILPVMFFLFCEAVRSLRLSGWSPLSFLAAMVFLLCWPFLFSLLQPSPYFSSESYILGLLIMFAVFPVMTEYGAEPKTVVGNALCLFVFALAVLLGSSAKISTGAVMAAGLSFFIVIAGTFSVGSVLAALIACVAPFLLVFFSSLGSGGDNFSIISPLHFLFTWPQEALFHAVLTGITGVVVLKTVNWSSKSGRVIISLYAMAVAALISSMLVELPAGAAMFFANPGMWICILLFVVLLPAPQWPQTTTSGIQFATAMVTFIAISAVEKERWRAFEQLGDADKYTDGGSAQVAKLNSELRSQIEGFIASNGRNFVVYVSPDFDNFWNQNDICWAQSFVIPALTGQPMLSGLPPKDRGCEVTSYYGFAEYDLNRSSSMLLTESELCAEALNRGFSNIMRFDDQNGRIINCNG